MSRADPRITRSKNKARLNNSLSKRTTQTSTASLPQRTASRNIETPRLDASWCGNIPVEMSATEAPSNVNSDENTLTNQASNSTDPNGNDGRNNSNPNTNTNPSRNDGGNNPNPNTNTNPNVQPAFILTPMSNGYPTTNPNVRCLNIQHEETYKNIIVTFTLNLACTLDK